MHWRQRLEIKSELVRQFLDSLTSKMTVTIWVIAILGCTLAGPFDSYDILPMWPRSIYWTAVITGSILIGYLAFFVSRVLLRTPETHYVRCLSGVSGSLFVSLYVWWVSDVLVWHGQPEVTFAALLIYVAFVFAALIVSRILIANLVRREVDQLNSQDRPLSSPEPRLRKRLPASAKGRILRLTADDHFVVVATQEGETSLRMRLRDAILEMDDVEGTLVHRSHWVAYSAIQSARRAGGRLYLVLENGDEVPVSRSYRPALETANIPAVINATEAGQCEASAPS